MRVCIDKAWHNDAVLKVDDLGALLNVIFHERVLSASHVKYGFTLDYHAINEFDMWRSGNSMCENARIDEHLSNGHDVCSNAWV